MHYSYIRHEMLATMYEFTIHVQKFYHVSIGINSTDNYFGILVSKIWLSSNEFIFKFQSILNVSFYELLYN